LRSVPWRSTSRASPDGVVAHGDIDHQPPPANSDSDANWVRGDNDVGKPVNARFQRVRSAQWTMARFAALALLAALCVGHAGAMYDGEDSPVKMLDAKVPRNAAPPSPCAPGRWVAAGSLTQSGAGVRARDLMAQCPRTVPDYLCGARARCVALTRVHPCSRRRLTPR